MSKTSPNDDNLTKRLRQRYSIAQRDHLIRKNLSIESRHQMQLRINRKPCINFASNDYLGLSSSRSVLKAFKRSIKQYGFGSGSSVAISGYSTAQGLLEKKFATFLNREAAVFLNSGYLANLSIFSALASRGDTILSDKLCHASILDGILLTQAKHKRFLHNDLSSLENRLQQTKGHCFIISESIFSMEGDISPISDIASLAKQYQATFIVDDAHGFGILGETGGGICEHYHLSPQEVPCLVVPFGKAVGGYGAIVAGDHDIIQAIIQQARAYRYTTALPTAVIAANIKALAQLEVANYRRKYLQTLIEFFIRKANALKLPLISNHQTPIKTILVKNNKKAQLIQSHLLEKGLLVSSIRPPTVPSNLARIRISINYHHSKKSIAQLLEYLKDAYERY